jgi:glycerophosphoryl diester phosphodiesterase
MTNIKSADIIGHRGSSFLAPENTLAAFNLGWQETNICEADIQLTADGRIIVIHDATTARTTGVNYKVNEHSLDSLQLLDAGSWKGPQWQGVQLPSLEEVIDAMPDDKQLLIEIKTGPEVIPELARVIEASGKADRLRLQGFFYSACVAARQAFPETPIYLLVAATQEMLTKEWGPPIEDIIARATSGGFDGVGLNDTGLLNYAAIQKFHAAGLRVQVWTIDQVNDAKRLLDMEVDGLITNRPGRLRTALLLT